MRLTMADKKSLTKVFARKYKYASKNEKILILNEFIEYTGYNRNYAARVLRDANSNTRKPKIIRRKKRKPFYDEDARSSLERIWEISDYICGKRLVALIPEMIIKFDQFDEYEISENCKEKLMKISAATVDRILEPARRKLGRKGSSMTKGTTYLIDRIPVKTFGEWTNKEIGYTQLDLVAHNGGDVYGGFLYTLNSTDISTSWTTCMLVKDKTMPEMLLALEIMIKSFPFPLKGIHSDNGSEFINDSVLKFTKKNKLEFTRSRPYKKNDNPHVEQKNHSIIRRNTGYLRYDKPEHAEELSRLYGYLNLYVNYFQPTMVLVEKHRVGAKSIRKYDKPKTPYQRVLERDDIPASVKTKIKGIYKNLNPVELKKNINECQTKLIRMAAPIRMPVKPKRIRRKKQDQHTIPKWRRDNVTTKVNPFLERQRMEEMRRAADLVLSKRQLKN